MGFILLTVLFLVTALFYLLESSLESFSRISLAKFLKEFENKNKLNFYYVEKYDLAFHSLRTFVFFLQLILMLFTFRALETFIPNPIVRTIAVLVSFLILFNLIFYLVSYLNKEKVFNTLFFLFPFVWYAFYPLNKIFSLFLKEEAGEERETVPDDVSNEELEVFFEEGAKEGVLEKEDQEMIESVLEFGDTLVKEVMTPRVDMIHIPMDASLDEIVRTINESKKSRYPVISRKIDNIEGILLSKDVFNYWDRDQFNIKEVLRPALFIPETMRILELLKEMQRSKQKFAIVVDEFGGVSGAVTMEDLIEEIVGDIKDEYDEDSEPIVRENGSFIVKGDTDIYELGKTLNFEIDENEDYQTVAGLISVRLGKIAKAADKISIDGYVFEVLEVEKNRIKKVKIYLEPK